MVQQKTGHFTLGVSCTEVYLDQPVHWQQVAWHVICVLAIFVVLHFCFEPGRLLYLDSKEPPTIGEPGNAPEYQSQSWHMP